MAQYEGRYKKLAKNTTIFAVANFGSTLLRFLIVPFYTYYLTTSEYGIVDTLSTTVSLCMPIVILGMQEAVLRFTLDKLYSHASVIKIALLILCVDSIIALALYIPLSKFQLFNGLWWLFYCYLICYAVNNILLNYTRGTGNSIIFMCGGILNTVVMLVCNIVMIAVLKLGVKGYLYSLILGYAISSLFLFFKTKLAFALNEGIVERTLFKEMLKYSLPLMPTAAMWWVMNAVDRYAINYFLGVSATGIFAIAHKVPTVISVCYSVFQQAWQISAVDAISAYDREKFYGKVYDIFFRGLFLLSSFVILIIEPLLAVTVSSAYVIAWKYTPFLLLGSVFASMAGFLGVNYVVTKKSVGALSTSAIGAFANIIFNITLIPYLGLQGSALATLLGFYVVWLVRASIFNGGIKIEQNYLLIHILLGLEILQSLIIIFELPYRHVAQILFFLIIIFIDRKILIDIYQKIKVILQNKTRRKI